MSAFPNVVVRVSRMDGGPHLVIEDSLSLAHVFFTQDASSLGPDAYDTLAGKGDPVRILTADIEAINRTMRARSPHSAWKPILDTHEPLPWLAVIDPTWDLLLTEDETWPQVEDLASAAMVAAVAPYRNLSVMTKVLHLKRPRLFPVLDSLVVDQIGGQWRSPKELLGHMRQVARDNRSALTEIRRLLDEAEIARTPARILDVLLWSTHPRSSLAPLLPAWEHRFAPVTPAQGMLR